MTARSEDREHRDELHDSVRLRRERHERWLEFGERSIGQNIAMIGMLGWLIVTPTLVGIFFGRWLDARFGTGIFWSAALIVVGLTFGCWLAWQRIRRE